MDRRTFLAASTAALGAGGVANATRLPIRKGIYVSMLPRSLSYAERFKLAREVGFEEVECGTVTEAGQAEEIRTAAQTAGLRIHSVMNQAHWKFPLSSSDPKVIAESLKGMETSLENAHLWGADTVLLVPAVVSPQTRYADACAPRAQRGPKGPRSV